MKKFLLFLVVTGFLLGQAKGQSERVWNLKADSGWIDGIDMLSCSFKQLHDTFLPNTKISRSKIHIKGKWYYTYVMRNASANDTNAGIEIQGYEYWRWQKMMTWSGTWIPAIYISKGRFSNGLEIGVSTINDICTLYPEANCIEFEGHHFVRYKTCVFSFDEKGKLAVVKVSKSVCLFLKN